MFRKINYSLILACTVALMLGSCTKWDKHNELRDPALGKDLFQQVSESSDLSKFAELLVKSGFDKVIAGSKTFTVFAPTNAALATLDAATINDSAKLAMFVGNHIATQSYYTAAAATPLRIQMLNGKYNNLLGKKLEDANITIADKVAKNGVLQVIDKMIPPLSSTWEAFENNTLIPAKQRAYLQSLYRNVFDATNAIQTGVDPLTGKPIYKPGTDSVRSNLYWTGVQDLRNESKQFTFFVLADAAWDAEVLKMKPYYATTTTDSTIALASWDAARDLAVEGIYSTTGTGLATDTLLTKFLTRIPVQKSSIIQTIKTSNGVIYVMSQVNTPIVNKLKPFYIEAENYSSTSNDRRGNTYFRDRYNILTGKNFRDVLVSGHGVALFNIKYRVPNSYSTKYKAYWVALNDFQTAAYSQRLALDSSKAVGFPYTVVALNDYNEIYLGEVALLSYRSILDVYLVAANSTTAAVNPLVCDYIRLVPQP
ncbi:MAG: fasciclin domain-containing protein [Chitinophagaceae bacterium]